MSSTHPSSSNSATAPSPRAAPAAAAAADSAASASSSALASTPFTALFVDRDPLTAAPLTDSAVNARWDRFLRFLPRRETRAAAVGEQFPPLIQLPAVVDGVETNEALSAGDQV